MSSGGNFLFGLITLKLRIITRNSPGNYQILTRNQDPEMTRRQPGIRAGLIGLAASLVKLLGAFLASLGRVLQARSVLHPSIPVDV
jgi:hypothetical protein